MVVLNSFPENGMQAISHPLQSSSLWDWAAQVNPEHTATTPELPG
jgi:hypothetical protein